MRKLLIVATLAMTCFAAFCFADLYKVTVTREESNLYKVDYSSPKIYIKTRYCYEYAYSEEAVVDTQRMKIHFMDSDSTCDIDEILTSR